MKRLFLACLFIGMLTQSITCMETSETLDLKQLVKALTVGAISGCAEVVMDQPLIAIKNLLQLPKEKRRQIELNRKTFLPTVYRGLGANLAGMGPATALQMLFERILKRLIKSDDFEAKLSRASAAGALSALAATPIELVRVQQQLMKCSAPTTMKAIAQTGGLASFYRAFWLVAAREGLWTPAYYTISPFLAQKLEDKGYNRKAGTLVGGSLTGILVAALTQPFDTIETVLQTDYKKAELKGVRDAVRAICSEIDEKSKKPGGVRKLWKGLEPRAARAAIAIPFLAYMTEFLKNQMEGKT